MRRKCKGAMPGTEAAGELRKLTVGERCAVGRRGSESEPGRSAREDAGISSEKWRENRHRRKPKVS